MFALEEAKVVINICAHRRAIIKFHFDVCQSFGAKVKINKFKSIFNRSMPNLPMC